MPQPGRKRLICHCAEAERCHVDILRNLFVEMDPEEPEEDGAPPSKGEAEILAQRLGRETRNSDEVERASFPSPGAAHRPGTGEPL